STTLGFLAVACSSTNVVGGFLITDRMLKMFKSERDRTAQWGRPRLRRAALPVLLFLAAAALAIPIWVQELRLIPATEMLRYLYVPSGFLFTLGLKGRTRPKWARQGMFLAEFGMLVAIVGTLFHEHIKTYHWIILGLLVGSIVGGSMGLRIPMTAVP